MNGLRADDNPRTRHTNPRAKGTNPRAVGTNPRAPLTAAQRFDELEHQARRQRARERSHGASDGRIPTVDELERCEQNRDALRRLLSVTRAGWRTPAP